jgi:hypothetical protein
VYLRLAELAIHAGFQLGLDLIEQRADREVERTANRFARIGWPAQPLVRHRRLRNYDLMK